jgi:hypothetical protein
MGAPPPGNRDGALPWPDPVFPSASGSGRQSPVRPGRVASTWARGQTCSRDHETDPLESSEPKPNIPTHRLVVSSRVGVALSPPTSSFKTTPSPAGPPSPSGAVLLRPSLSSQFPPREGLARAPIPADRLTNSRAIIFVQGHPRTAGSTESLPRPPIPGLLGADPSPVRRACAFACRNRRTVLRLSSSLFHISLLSSSHRCNGRSMLAPFRLFLTWLRCCRGAAG